MAITKPVLPPKKGYVEVEVDGKRTYRNAETGVLIDDEIPTPTTEERVTELENTIVSLEDAICEMDEANDERMAAIEDALCEMDMG